MKMMISLRFLLPLCVLIGFSDCLSIGNNFHNSSYAARQMPLGHTDRFNPGCAKKPGDTFCEEVDEYPGDVMANNFRDVADEFKALLGVDEIEEQNPVAQRAFDPNESPLCGSRVQMIFPKAALNKNDNWRYIVNNKEYRQGIRVETCLNSEDQCMFSESFPSGYRSACKQKYVYRKLIALDEKTKPITDVFQFPSCCSCSVTMAN